MRCRWDTTGAGALQRRACSIRRANYPDGFPRIISDGYFHAMGIPLKAGRDFTERDTKGTLNVIIMNETLARNLWPGEDPIGKIVRADDPERTVVGVVGDVRHMALEEGSGNEFYIPMRQTRDYGDGGSGGADVAADGGTGVAAARGAAAHRAEFADGEYADAADDWWIARCRRDDLW